MTGVEAPVAGEGDRQDLRRVALQLLLDALLVEGGEVVHGPGEVEVAERVEAAEEVGALVVEIVLDLEVRSEARLCPLDPACAAKLVRERLFREVGDVGHHPGHRQPDVRPAAALVVSPALEVRVTHDRLAGDGREGDVHCAKAGAGTDRQAELHRQRVVDRPLQRLHAAERAAERGVELLDPKLRQEAPVNGVEVADAEHRELKAVALAGRRVDRRRAGRPLAAAKQVRRDHEELLGVNRLAGADQPVPPAAPLRIAMVTGGVGVAGQCVADEDRIIALFTQLTVRFIRDLNRPDRGAGFEDEWVFFREADDRFGLDLAEAACFHGVWLLKR